MELAYLILPDCILVTIGWLLKNKFKFTAEFFTGLEKLVYFVLFPALMIRSLTMAPISFAKASNFLIICLLLAFTGLFFSYLLKKYLRVDPKSIASSGQCAYRFNTYIGLSLAPAIAGSDSAAVMAILIGFSVPIVNVIAVNSMAKHQGNNPLIEVLKNPLVLSTIFGLMLNFSGITIPAPLNATLAKLSQSTVPLGLICVGAALILQTGTQQFSLISWLVGIRLLIMPIVAIILAFIFGLNSISSQTLILFAALPTASAAYILAVRMGGDGRTVASIISIGTVISVLTLPLWIFISQQLFPIVP
ncbi:membrane protein [Pelistega indica]|uniref:Membrane protein n=1 Tax=Pelistega indica TaxID=1414851 RepID=V8GBC2_9BURK|nr:MULTISPECIES: AEC family transporter [Pelistega]ETD73042.1 membrane protein [Pelistega indica]